MAFVLFLLLVFLPDVSPAEARARLAGQGASSAAWEAHCASSYQQFQGVIAERRAAERPVYDRAARLRERNAAFSEIDAADNRAYIERGRIANLGLGPRGELYFDLENAVLKLLNDEVVRDKDVVTALTNLHKEVFWQQISRDPVLRDLMPARYSDFKSLRGVLTRDTPEIRARFTALVADVNERVASHLERLAVDHSWAERARGLSADRRNWFHSGLGRSPDEAGLAARCSRQVVREAGAVARAQTFEGCVAMLTQAARNLARYQSWMEKRFSGTPRFFADAGGGRRVPSAELIETLLKTKGADAPSTEAALREALRLRFGLDVSPREVQALKNYLEQVDRFSPGIFSPERVVIHMDPPGVRSVLSADFMGQNARNLEEVAKALARTEGRPLADRVREFRRAEEIATASLEEKKARFQRVVERMFPGTRGQFSGDDGMAFLPRTLTEEDKLRFAREWAREGGGPRDLRLTFEEFRYADTGAVVPVAERAALVGQAEEVEKKLRLKLLADLGPERLNGLQILVSFEARERGPGQVHLQLVGLPQITPALRQRIEGVVTGLGHGIGRLQGVP